VSLPLQFRRITTGHQNDRQLLIRVRASENIRQLKAAHPGHVDVAYDAGKIQEVRSADQSFGGTEALNFAPK
jgi:hypothetical protein